MESHFFHFGCVFQGACEYPHLVYQYGDRIETLRISAIAEGCGPSHSRKSRRPLPLFTMRSSIGERGPRIEILAFQEPVGNKFPGSTARTPRSGTKNVPTRERGNEAFSSRGESSLRIGQSFTNCSEIACRSRRTFHCAWAVGLDGKGRTGCRIVGTGAISMGERFGDWNDLMANDDVIDTIQWCWRMRGGTVPSGDRDMTSTRGRWIRFLLLGMSLGVAPVGIPGARAAKALTRFSRTTTNSNNLSDRSARSPAAQVRPARWGADNQYQQYLKELDGADRALNQRYGIGVQYWKLRSDIELDKRAMLNRRPARQNEDFAASISQKYLAYFSEDNPRKRAILMRDFATNRQPMGAAGERGRATPRTAKPGSSRAVPSAEAADSRRGRSHRDVVPRAIQVRAGEAASGRPTPPAPPAARTKPGWNGTDSAPTVRCARSFSRLGDDLPVRRRPTAADRRNADAPATPSPDN